MSDSTESKGPSTEELWRLFRYQKERCAGCGTRLKWDEQGVRGRAGGWVLAPAPEGETGSCICFRCHDHQGPKIKFHIKSE
ncbi:MAG: hypothetical protein RBU45_00330 [Myxococcota bacterium]|jgi:hypothetical protein|nr:hypothetical protein [Myxococcota bacterium]